MPSSSLRGLRLAVLALTVVSLAHVAAHAQESGSAPPASPKKSGPRHQPISLSFYTGTTSAKSADLRLLQPRFGTDVTYHDVDFEGKPFHGSPYYGIKVGYFLPKSPRVGFEFEYNHAKMYAKVGESKQITGTWQGQPIDTVEPISNKVDEYRITNGINSLSFNIVYRVPVMVDERYPDGRLQPYIGGGPQYTALYSINTVAKLEAREKYYPNGWGYQFFGGVRYLFNPRVGGFLQGKYQHGDAVSLIADKDNNAGGRGVTDIRILHLAGGVFYQF